MKPIDSLDFAFVYSWQKEIEIIYTLESLPYVSLRIDKTSVLRLKYKFAESKIFEPDPNRPLETKTFLNLHLRVAPEHIFIEAILI